MIKNIFLALLSVICFSLYAQEAVSEPNPEPKQENLFTEADGKALRWRLKPGEIVELQKFGEQNIDINGTTVKRNVFHRVLLEIKETDPLQGYHIAGTFRSHIRTREAKGAPYKQDEQYQGDFILRPNGSFEVPQGQYMPNVRSIPTFPEADPFDKENPMKPGYRWQSQGEEAMQGDNNTVVVIPIEVAYEYLGRETVKIQGGLKILHKIQSNYQINYDATGSVGTLPRKMFGMVTTMWLWDEAEGMPYLSRENYNIIMVYDTGETQEYQTNHRSLFRKIKPVPASEKQNMLDGLQRELSNLKSQANISVKAESTEKGISITLPDVLFDYNSSDLTSQSRDVLNKICDVLASLSEHPILVAGHSDNVGGDEFNLNLSTERASTVADYLAKRLKSPPERISFEGYGKTHPIVDNSTEQGRARNRRVEIILLDK